MRGALEQVIVAESPAQEQMKAVLRSGRGPEVAGTAAIKKFDEESISCGFNLIAGVVDRKLLETAKVI